MFFETYKSELIVTGFLLLFLIIVRFILTRLITKISRKNGINLARIHLINRYVSVTLFIIGLLIIPFIFGTEAKDLAVLFSSVFAVIGIGLFAIWSILSNITSGIIMFFSFPYKV
jgi:hypothetical protein